MAMNGKGYLDASNLPVKEFDGIIVGGGGSGLMAGLQLAQSGMNTAVVSKVFPTRSHTVSAQGGITCAIASADPNDDWRWHMYDTVKGQILVATKIQLNICIRVQLLSLNLRTWVYHFLEQKRAEFIKELLEGNQKITVKEVKQKELVLLPIEPVMLYYMLYQANIKAGTNFLSEWFAVDLVLNDSNQVTGVIAFEIESGEAYFLKAKATVLATGGQEDYKSTTNALINTGDGTGMALRAGLAVQDMEMWQFHPTGIHGAGTLVTEGCRGEGGYLINKDGERFMERYAPNAKDLASRDVVARAMMALLKAEDVDLTKTVFFKT